LGKLAHHVNLGDRAETVLRVQVTAAEHANDESNDDDTRDYQPSPSPVRSLLVGLARDAGRAVNRFS
jgi:hypothetical protein